MLYNFYKHLYFGFMSPLFRY